jgi:hypothetical protein
MANTSNSSTLTTDFNVTPYWDDYESDKNYYRILYKPGYAVQARELTQSQTILQNQISRFGKHIFKEGSIVIPGKYNIETDTDYVKVKDVDNANNSVAIGRYDKKVVTNPTTGLQAKIELVEDGTESSNNAKTIFVSYLNSATTNNQIKVFQAGDVLVANTGETLVVATSVPSGGPPITGKGSRFVIEDGVFFAKDHFISFPRQSVILDRYSQTPTCRIGFFISEEIISFEDDTSLLDPALESSNYAAPGADRLKLDPQLQVLPFTDTTGAPDFVELFSIENGVVTEIYERPQYNIIRDELAKQKFDESGDYYVNGLSVRVRENLDTGTNGGFSNTGNSQLLSIGVEPGVGYVKGYEINKLVTEYITIDKSTTFKVVNTQLATATTGSYVSANQVTGSITHDTGALVNLYDKEDRRLSNKLWASGSPTGNSIGTARVFATQYNSGILGTPDGTIDIFITDIRMNGTNTFASVKSLYTSGFGADIVPNQEAGNTTILQDVSISTLVYQIGPSGIKSVRGASDAARMTFDFYRTGSGSFVSGGTLSFAPSFVTGESFPYGTTTLSDGDKREIIVSLDSGANVSGTGTVSNSVNVITAGTTGAFGALNPGDRIEFSGNTLTWTVGTKQSTSQVTLAEPDAPSLTTNTWFRVYNAGDIIDLTTSGLVTQTERSVSADPTTLSFNLQETFPSSVAAKIRYPVARVNTAEATKELKSDRLVRINVASAGTTTGPYNLGFPDIFKINKIVRKTGSAPSSLTDGTDVTTSFDLDNGQRDMFYDHGTITPRITLDTTDHLLISLDHFYPSFSPGFGYFTVDSYPIDDSASPAVDTIRTEEIPFFTSPTTKATYDLRNVLDFRPMKTISANDVTTISASTTTNPAQSTTFYYDSDGIRLPVPSSRISYDFQYFEPRRDIIAIDKSGIITHVKGIPGSFPITPDVPSNAMGLASIYVAPYPSLAPNYAQDIRRKDLGCVSKKISNVRFTMRDIGVLKDRIVNLEYYTSLNTLEKAAIELRIRDENGLDRFKNGIFVDPFNEHIFGDSSDPNYRIVIDKQEKSIRPIYTMHSIGYDYVSGTNVKQSGDLVTLDYSEEPLIDQPKATTNRNIELTSYRFIGNIYLNPDVDVWRDTNRRPDEVVYTGPDPDSIEQGVVTTWGEWTTTTGQTQRIGAGSVASFLKGLGDIPVNVTEMNNKGRVITANRSVGAANTLLSSRANLSKRDYLVVSSSSSVRKGVETTTTLGNLETVSVNDKLIDVSLVPYIRSQTINVVGRGFKPNTTLNFFFDGENMNKYVTPYANLGISNTQTVLLALEDGQVADVADFNAGFWYYSSNTEGSQITSSNNGEIYFKIRLPEEKPFRVGTKELVVTDSITNSVDASTYGKSYFVAHGLVQTKQNTILTTRQLNQTSRAVFETSNRTTATYYDAWSCAAYSFVPKAPAGEEGVFLTSVDLFFSAKHPTLGVWFEIREMDAGGGIIRNQLPFSEVWLTTNQVNVSSDASAATNIKFSAPVFLYSDTQYAFVIHTEGLNPDYYFWISRLGETDVTTGQQVTSRGLTGAFYTTNNNRNWDIVPDVDLKVKFYRAKFDVGSGEVVLGNKPVEKLLLANVSSDLNTYGERFIGNDRITLSANTSTINVGDFIVGSTSGANGVVRTITGSTFGVGNNFFTTTESVSLLRSNGLSYATSTITAKKTAVASVYTYKIVDDQNLSEFVASQGNFYVGDTIKGVASGKTATVNAIANLRYTLVDFEPSYIRFNKTPVSFQMRTYSNTAVQGPYFDIVDGDDYYFEDERAIFSRTIEKDSFSNEQSNRVKVAMSTFTDFLSPVLDVGRTHTVYVNNTINANTRYESGVSEITLSGFANGSIANVGVSNVLIGATSSANAVVDYKDGSTIILSSGGFIEGERVFLYNANLVSINAISANVATETKVQSPSTPALYNKYISVPITLAEGQDAEDLNVILTAYRPPSTDVKVYVKIIHNEDSDTIVNAPWIELEKAEVDVFSSLAVRDDFKEISYRFPSSVMTGPNDEVQYKNSLGITFTGFKYYAIKIGLLGGPENTTSAINSAYVPRVADLRVVCLQR